MPTDPQDPQLQLQKLFKINMWLGIAALVLLILLIATVIAPYIHFGRTGETEKLMGRLDNLEKSIQENATGKLTAQHFDKELKSLKCEVRKPTPAASAMTNEDTAKILREIDEVTDAIQTIPPGTVISTQPQERLNQLKLKLRALRNLIE